MKNVRIKNVVFRLVSLELRSKSIISQIGGREVNLHAILRLFRINYLVG